jgi:4-hydroxy-tetrahydrodipicolinate synthase
MPPYIAKKGLGGIFEYYQAIAGAVDLPVFVQNAAPPLGSALPPAFVARLVREIGNVQYVKEEVPPSGHSISAVVAACGREALGVFGGAGGRYLIEELRRGAAGNMPACQFTDVLVEVYTRYLRGDEEGARRLHTQFLPLINLSVGEGAVMKEVLRRRGIFETTLSRVPRPTLDAHDLAELEQALTSVSSHFKIHPPRLV